MDHLKKRLMSLKSVKGLRSSRPFNVHNYEIADIDSNSQALLINFSSNDYLGLAGDPALIKEFNLINELDTKINWMSASSARPLTGTSEQHDLLEKVIAKDYGKQAALLFNSGYHANSGILPAITDKDDLILADKLVHASIIDGLRLSNASFKRFSHNDLAHLERLLQKYAKDYARIWIVTESLFSMDGDFAPLKALVEIKKHYSASLYVDEAHAIGCYGSKGLGLSEELDIISDVDVLVGVFGKATAGVGAFVTANQFIIDNLINYSRSWLFSTALPPINIAWNLFIWNKLESFSVERSKLQQLTQSFRQQLESIGLDALGQSHIVPLLRPGNEQAIATSDFLEKKGFLAMAIRSPTVKKGSERVRFSLTANLPSESLDSVVNVLQERV